MQQFPDFHTWCADVLHPEDTSPWDFRTREFYEEYRTKYAIAKAIQPRSILEVGVRFGYGAQSFLMASEANYIGLDADEPSWGPYQGVPRQWAEARLRERFPSRAIITYGFDTQCGDVVDRLGLGQVDMVHIDADHSFDGALQDMQTFWPLCRRVMVVDDYIEIAAVRSAVKAFCGENNLMAVHVDSLRGSVLMVRDG